MLATARPAPGAPAVRQAPAPSAWRHVDVLLVLGVAALAVFGVVMVYSATRVPLETAGFSATYYAKKQAIFAALGFGLMVVVAAVDYRRYRAWAWPIYGLAVFLLVAVLGVGHRIRGSQAWFQVGSLEFEPSEFAKFALIIALAAYASRSKGQLPLRRLIVVLLMTAVPFLLIFKQPDLGTAMILTATVLALVMVAGVRLRHLLALGVLAAIGVAGLIHAGVLHKYQEERLASFLHTPNQVSRALLANPNSDVAANEYNVVESKNAISNGGVHGQGLFGGSMTNQSDVPEQYTDFIFSAVGEQLGLIGTLALLALYLLVVWRTWMAASLAKDHFGTLLCTGVLAMLTFQVFENAGMAMGIMPVAGIPLPWLSYGGSSVIIDFLCVGLVLNVRMRRFT